MLSTDLLPCVADVLEVIKIYGDKRPLEKALKNSAGVNQDRVSDGVAMF